MSLSFLFADGAGAPSSHLWMAEWAERWARLFALITHT